MNPKTRQATKCLCNVDQLVRINIDRSHTGSSNQQLQINNPQIELPHGPSSPQQVPFGILLFENESLHSQKQHYLSSLRRLRSCTRRSVADCNTRIGH